ncbi:MAG: cupin domain-containing protein [Chitinophagaceae bacterium]
MKAILLLSFLLLTIVQALVAQQDTLSSHVYNLAKLPVKKDSSRLRVQMMDGSTSRLSNLEAHLTILQPGQAAHPPHTHANTEELIIVKEGVVAVTIKGKTKLLSAGGLALSLPGDAHGAINAGKTNASYYVIKYTKAAVDAGRGESAGGSILMDWNEPAVSTTDKGERRQFFNHATALFNKFDMHVTTLNKGEVSHPPHTHLEEEIIIVRQGNISMQIGDQFYPAKPGDLIFLSSGVPHALQNTGKLPTTYFAFQWQ